MPRVDTHVVTERAQQGWLPDARAVRIARHTERLDEVVDFYRDGIGLIEIGGFRGHAGYGGVVLAVPDTGAHLELTAGGEHGVPVPHPESLFVIYLGDVAAVKITLRRLGVEPIAPANPYWAKHGVTVADPDGFRVVLVPEWWAPFGDGGNAATPAAVLRVDY
jgi:catechol 2,3-dioxygenase-like lactoylglutathione lyase family enzyme